MGINQGRMRILFGLAFVVALVWVGSLSSRRNAAKEVKAQQRLDDSNAYNGPIVDYDNEVKPLSASDPQQRVKQEARFNRYNHRAPEPLGEFASVVFEISTHWSIGLPSLPVAQSDTVVLGSVTDAQAHLSSDRAGLYSEFTLKVDRVFKEMVPPIEDTPVVEREGGVVRFSSGRLLPYRVAGQRLPALGGEYLFFLKHNPQGDDYHIITAYEIRRNHIFPLDKPEAFKAYEGVAKEDFLRLLQDAIADSFRQKGGRNN